ncbi:MAG: YqhA family protein [Thermomicrobiales bacterium]
MSDEGNPSQSDEEAQAFVPVPRQHARRGSSASDGDRDARRSAPYADHHRMDELGATVGMSRFTIVLAILGTGLSSAAVMLYSLIATLKVIWHAFTESGFDVDGAKHLVIDVIEITDFFLFGMVLYVVGIGMYQLFVSPDIRIPAWMRVHSLDDLKAQLINVIAVLLAVSFLAVAVSWTSDRSILYFGLATAAMILALAIYSSVHHRIAHGRGRDTSAPDEPA